MTKKDIEIVEDGINTVKQADEFIQSSTESIKKLKCFIDALKDARSLSIDVDTFAYNFQDFEDEDISAICNYLTCIAESRIDIIKSQKETILKGLYKIFKDDKNKENNESN